MPSLPVTVLPPLAWFEAPKAGEGSQCGTNSDFATARIDLCWGTFALHILWIVAVVFFLAWVVSFVLGKGRRLAWR